MAIAGLGTDIIEIARLGKDDTITSRLARRILTEYEYGIYQNSKTKLAYLAKRFAAKEATVKAFGTGIGNGVSWQHIEVRNNEAGGPFLTLSGELAVLCEKRGIKQTFLSISDEQSYAVATVILES